MTDLRARVFISRHVLHDKALAACYASIKRIRDNKGYLPYSVALALYRLDKHRLRPALEQQGLAEYYAGL